MSEERLSKFLEHSGIASRRKSEEIIRSGRVTVNGVKVSEPQFKVDDDRASISVDGKPVKRVSANLYIALYKPVKFLSDLNAADDRDLARNLIKIEGYLFPVGRLDYSSEGLIIFTNDGEFANKVTHPRYQIEKEYLVKFKGALNREEMNQMKHGLVIDGSLHKVEKISYIKASLQNSWYSIVLREGKNRMIRKMGEKMGHQVLKLKRVRIGSIGLGSLRPGEYRFLEDYEIRECFQGK